MNRRLFFKTVLAVPAAAVVAATLPNPWRDRDAAFARVRDALRDDKFRGQSFEWVAFDELGENPTVLVFRSHAERRRYLELLAPDKRFCCYGLTR